LLAIVPARGGSKGIPRKALCPLNGVPLIEYTLRAARESNLDAVLISTDDEAIARFGSSIMRPPELAQDDTPMLPVVEHALEVCGPVDAVMLLQPTSPLRTAIDINGALALWETADKPRCLVSVCAGIHPKKLYTLDGKPFITQTPYDKHKDGVYTRNGAIFITSIELLNERRLFDDSPLLYVMPKTRSVDIDDYEDLKIAEALLKCGVS
jgi:CMP-N-acetylneuraminic acid synthetase